MSIGTGWRLGFIQAIADYGKFNNYSSSIDELERLYRNLEHAPDKALEFLETYWEGRPETAFVDNFDTVLRKYLTPVHIKTITEVYMNGCSYLEAAKRCNQTFHTTRTPSTWTTSLRLKTSCKYLLKMPAFAELMLGTDTYERLVIEKTLPLDVLYADPTKIKLEDAGLSTRAFNMLIRASGVRGQGEHPTIGEVIERLPTLNHIKNLGPQIRLEVLCRFKELGVDTQAWEKTSKK